MYLVCWHSEKTLQLTRLLQREASLRHAAKFIVYFSTCAAVDYFYRVRSALQLFALKLTRLPARSCPNYLRSLTIT